MVRCVLPMDLACGEEEGKRGQGMGCKMEQVKGLREELELARCVLPACGEEEAGERQAGRSKAAGTG